MAKELIKLWHSVSGNSITATVSGESKMKPLNLDLIRRWVSSILGLLLIGAWLLLSAMHDYLFWEEAIISLGIILCLLLFRTLNQFNQYDSKTKQ